MTTQARVSDRPRLLFVDDEPRVLNSMRAMFRRDFELFLTTRGDEALKILSEQQIDVLVADQRMPVMTGVELLSTARTQSPGTVRILLTGYSDPEAIDGAIKDGKVFRLLNKPCAAQELRKIIGEAVQIARENPHSAPEIVVDRHKGLRQIRPADTAAAASSARTADPATSDPVVPGAGPATGTADYRKPFEVGEFADIDTSDIDGIENHAYDVDEFADTATMEIVMSGETITVLEDGDTQPRTYNAPAPGRYIPPEPPPQEPAAEDLPSESASDSEPEPDSEATVAEPAGDDVELGFAPAPSYEAADVAALRASPPVHSNVASDSPTLLLYVLGAVLGILTLAWLLLNAGDSDAPVTVATTGQPAAPVADPASAPERYSLAENLQFGGLALDAGALISPPGASALAFYLDARAQSPTDERVAQGLERLAEQIVARARGQLNAQDYPALLTSLRALSAIDAVDPRLVSLRADFGAANNRRFAQVDEAIAAGNYDGASALIEELAALPFADPGRVAAARESLNTAVQSAELQRAERTAARAAAAAARAAVAEPEPATVPVVADQPAAEAPEAAAASNERQIQIDDLFASLDVSIDAGRLIEPQNDNARHYLQQIEQVEPDNPRLIAGQRQLAGALVQRALTLASNAQWADAEATLTQAEALGVAGARVVRTREEILADRITRESARVITIGEMQPVTLVPARYPDHALREGTEGWALLHFTVLPDGTVADIETVETSGRYGGRFARAARSAAAKWQFEPREFLGQTIAQRVEARVKFELTD